MDKIVKERIDAINNHILPSGYIRTKDIGIAPSDWLLGKMSDVVTPVKRGIPKPDEPYWRLGIRSWAKGTFHEYVDDPESVDMDELYVVHENDLVISITFAWEHAIAIAKKEDRGLLVSHRFPTYEFKSNQCPGYYKVLIARPFFKDMLNHISPGGAGRNRVLNQRDFLNLPCYIPPYEEQIRIAELLQNQERLVKLHEEKIIQLQKMKKLFLQKLFPQNGVKTPEWRFPQFTDAWEQRKFSDFTFSAGERNKDDLDLEPYAITNNQGFIAQSEAHDDFGYMKDVDRKMYIVVKPNSFAYNPARINVGSLGYYEGAENVIVSSLYEVFQTAEYVDDKFLKHWFKTKAFQDWIERLQEGSVRLYFYYDKLCECIMSMPSMEEQRKIGAYLDKLDNLITLHQHKQDEEKRKQAAMAQLLLTGIVRVSG